MVRVLLVAVVAVAVLVSSRQVAAEECATPAAHGRDVATTTDDGAMTFRGENDRVSEPFRLGKGVIVVSTRYDGDGYLGAVLNHVGSPHYDRIVSTVGAYDGSVSISLYDNGRYFLSVETDGPWTVTIEQP